MHRTKKRAVVPTAFVILIIDVFLFHIPFEPDDKVSRVFLLDLGLEFFCCEFNVRLRLHIAHWNFWRSFHSIGMFLYGGLIISWSALSTPRCSITQSQVFHPSLGVAQRRKQLWLTRFRRSC